MTIKKVKIYGFGRHKDKEWDFTDGLNVIYGENETGKSTIFAFIRAMLYGLTGRGADNYRKKYLPWNFAKGTDKFGGELEFMYKGVEYKAISLWGESKREDVVKLFNNASGAEIRIPDGRTVGEHILKLTAGAFDSSIYIGQMSSVIKADDDKDGVLMSRLSAVSGLGESEASAVLVINRIKECMDKIKSPRGNSGILDKLYFKKMSYENEMNRLELTDGNAAAESEKLRELYAKRDGISEEIKENKKKIDIINALAAVKRKNSIMKSFEEIDVLNDKLSMYEEQAAEGEHETEKKHVPFSWYAPGLAFIALAIAFAAGGALVMDTQNLLSVVFVAAAIFSVIMAIVSLIGVKKKSDALSAHIITETENSLEKKNEIQNVILEKEKMLDDKLEGQSIEELEEIWRDADKTIDDAGKSMCNSLLGESADAYAEKNETLAEKLSELDSEIGYVKATIDGMYKNEKMSFSEASKMFYEIKEQIEHYERKYEGLKLAKQIAEESFEELRTTFGPVLSRDTENILNQIAGSRGNVKVGDDFKISVFDENMPRHISSYSGAAVDQTYFALRLAIAGIIAPKGQPYPLLLDDPFAQYDDDRLMKAMQFLTTYKDSQIILATCQKRGSDIGNSFYRL
ncbi:MAG: AAA family ATPase [Clostridia bacterium]|nr:AAA family ATPase [Clostridia bacterium]